MAVQLGRRISETELVDMQLDEILALREPYRTNVLRAWEAHLDEQHMGRVLIKASGGTTFKAQYRGRTVNIPPAGHRVARTIAIDLLSKYGRKGLYYQMDPATGMTPGHWAGLNEEQRSKYHQGEPNYVKHYLTHVPDVEIGLDDGLDDLFGPAEPSTEE